MFKSMWGLAIIAAATVTTSCNDDDDPTPPEDGFVLVRDDLKGEFEGEEVILESGTYKLTGKLIVGAGAKLTIMPGVVIEATQVPANEFASVRYIAVAQGGQIDVRGSADNPVVMTATEKKPGAWGGLVLCGRAPINKGEDAVSEVGELTYGGSVENDNSGSIRYLRLEYTGFAYNSDKEFNGLSMFGVGSGTTIEYVQAYEGSDDGFEWFGGTVSSNYLVVTNYSEDVGDDLFDWTEGWTGSGENWYGIRTNGGNRGIEADNNGNDHVATPVSNPTIRNLTLVGAGSAGSEPQAIKLRVGTKGTFDNVVLNNWSTGFDVEHDEGISFVGDGSLVAANVRFINVTTKATGKATNGNSANVDAIFTENNSATGAGTTGNELPSWAAGWALPIGQ
ncbi:hypothetical protein [Parapedobacter deserti]